MTQHPTVSTESPSCTTCIRLGKKCKRMPKLLVCERCHKFKERCSLTPELRAHRRATKVAGEVKNKNLKCVILSLYHFKTSLFTNDWAQGQVFKKTLMTLRSASPSCWSRIRQYYKSYHSWQLTLDYTMTTRTHLRGQVALLCLMSNTLMMLRIWMIRFSTRGREVDPMNRIKGNSEEGSTERVILFTCEMKLFIYSLTGSKG